MIRPRHDPHLIMAHGPNRTDPRDRNRIINTCPICGAIVSARYPEKEGFIVMERSCPHCTGIYSGGVNNPVFYFLA